MVFSCQQRVLRMYDVYIPNQKFNSIRIFLFVDAMKIKKTPIRDIKLIYFA